MQMKKKISLSLVLVLSLCSVLWFSAGIAAAAPPSPFAVDKIPGQKAPDFTLNDLNGKPVPLSAFKGKVILLNFWATWCPPCRDEMPALEKLNQLLKNKGLVVLSVSIDRSAASVKDFIKSTPVGFPVLFDDKLKVTRSLYKVFTVPTTFLIDKKGVVIEKYFGEQEWAKPEFVKKMESLL